MTDETESEKEFREVAERINDFTNILNKYNLEYVVKYYDEVAVIGIDKIEIQFFLEGGICFDKVSK
jgi:hypothetical protein